MAEHVNDLLGYIDASPTPYHAVRETARRLDGAGFTELSEAEHWQLEAGGRHYLVRNDGSIVAFEVGTSGPDEAGFRVIGAHTDSPNLRVKPLADVSQHGYRQLAVEPYGGVLLYTWLDRDLSLAGRTTVRVDGALRTVLVDFDRPLLRIPSLAIHLQPEVRDKGLQLNSQTHLPPVVGLGTDTIFAELLTAELSKLVGATVAEDDVVSHDLMTYDVERAAVGGAGDEFVLASRIDNLASCHSAVSALLLAAGKGACTATRMMVLHDHEEVGSRSAQGAAGTFVRDTIDRIVAAAGGDGQARPRALSQSTMVSVDMAHAVHPNYADKHEAGHRPAIGLGPVIKQNANLSYASDATTAGLFTDLCRRRDIEPQRFAVRSDLPCGSTIGPISAARVGIRTVDVGSPMLAMHSCREMAGTADVAPMIDVLGDYLSLD